MPNPSDGRPNVGRHGNPEIDLGLALLEFHARPGVCYSTLEIAAWCGCTKQAVSRIERSALRKLRPLRYALRRERALE